MTWRYGVIKKTEKIGKKVYHSYDVHEIHLSADGSVIGWTEEPITVSGETLADIRWMIMAMRKDCFRFPVYEVKRNKLVVKK